MKRMLLLFLLCVVCVTPFSLGAQARDENQDRTVTAMTRNMFPGADLGAVAAAQTTEEFELALRDTITSVIQSKIPKRAALVAAEIAANKPDLVALQEATKWKIKSTRGWIVLDQLELLMDALQRAGQHYRVAVVQKLTDVQIPDTISYTDRDAILVRSNRPLNVVGSETHIYDNLLELPFMGESIQVLRGWIAVDVKFHGSKFKFVNTHLEAPLPEELDPDRETKLLQYAQALQLVGDLSATSRPIILAGDFNSDAEPTSGYEPDKTLSYGYLITSGYTDPWHAFHDLGDYGYTWPLVDFMPPIERIDLILSKGLEALSMERIGATPVGGLYASDHAGMVAVFQLSNPR